MNIIQNIFSKFSIIINNNFGVLLIYFLLALFFTFPLILNIGDSVGGKTVLSFDFDPNENIVNINNFIGSDAYYFMWNLWFFKYYLLDLKTNPFSHSDLVFYPAGFNNSATGYDNLFNTILSLPLQVIFDNLILVYNILIIFNFIFASYTTYLLINYLIGNKKIAILGGLIFGFSPYMLARSLAHINLVTTGAIPLFILFFLKLLKEPKIKNSLFLAIAFLLVAISSWHYALFTLIFIVFSFIFFIFHKRQFILNNEFIKRFSLFIALSVLFILPVAFPMIQAYSNNQTAIPSIEEPTQYSADPLSYFTPSPLNSLVGQFIDPKLYISFSENYVESTTFIGFLEATFIFIYFMERKKMKGKGNLWIFLIIVFFILSLGPFLKAAGNIFDKLPLPYYYIFNYIPFFSFARDPVRFSIFIMLFTTIIFALTFKYILDQGWNRKKKILVTLILLFIVAERVVLPFPIEEAKIPSFYYKIAHEKRDYAILDLPVGVDSRHQTFNFYQTIHRKKIISGAVQHTSFNQEVTSWLDKNKFLKENICSPEMLISIASEATNNDMINSVEKENEKKLNKENLIKEFKNINIKYIIIHKKLINKYEEYLSWAGKQIGKDLSCQKFKNAIKDFFGDDQPIFEDELIKVYEI